MLYVFYGALILSFLTFVIIWVWHMTSLLRNRKSFLDFGRIMIWTIVPALMLASLSLFGLQIVDNIQKTPSSIQVDITGHM